MNLYFTTRQLPGLEDLSTTARLQVLTSVNDRLTKPEKLFLNILKLLLIIPVFVLFTGQYSIPTVLIGLSICTVLYPAVLRPIHLGIIAKYVDHAVATKINNRNIDDEEDEEDD